MIASNTICVSQEGPANALALNKDFSQVVIAGRNVFKVYAIGETEFTEVCNLRVGKNLNLNFSSIDVAWSTIEENTLATAATNGAVVVWNLGRSGRSKQEHVFSDHKRTVNKVSFHLSEPSLLISGSQDGTMKCFDLRMKEVARTFISNTESVRDVQFCPQQSQHFAAVSENGLVQVWDVRRHEKCLQQLNAHSAPVFACDWHPEMLWLATASRDKTIKVWNMQGKPTLEHTIYTIASVGHVKWRPQRKWQVSSCALVLDCAVHVWDVRRPYVPLATFADHRDVTTALGWQGEPQAFLSTSRDCMVYRHRWSSAAHPVVWASGRGVGVSARGEVLSATPLKPLPTLRLLPAATTPHPPPPALGRKQPTAGSLTGRSQASLETLFPTASQSIVTRWPCPLNGLDSVISCAKEYRLTGASTHELAKHNAAVAEKYNRHMTCVVWSVVGEEYCEVSAPPPPPPREPPARADPPPPQRADLLYNAAEEEPLSEVEEWADNQFHNSGVLGLPTHSIYIPPAKYAHQIRDSEPTGWVSAASAHFVDVSSLDWSLPEEAFPLQPPQAAHPPHAPTPDIEEHPATEHIGASASPSGGSSGGSSGPHYNHQSSVNTEDSEVSEGGTGLSVRGGAGRAATRASGRGGTAAVLAGALRHHADCGDVQTPATVVIVLQQNRSDLMPYIDESLQEQWLLGYIELLHRHKMFDLATEVIKHSWVVSVWCLSQQSTVVCVSCARCGRRSRPGGHCERCEPNRDTCAVCRQVVRGLFAWCQGCAHGGHLHHMQQWTQRHRLCPAGCGHNCRL